MVTWKSRAHFGSSFVGRSKNGLKAAAATAATGIASFDETLLG